MGPPTAEQVLNLDREHQDQLTQVFRMLDSDRDGLLTRKESEHAARLLGCHLAMTTPEEGKFTLPVFLRTLRRKTAELPEQALDVLASRFIASVRVRPQSSMKAEDLRRFFLESAENIPLSRLQDMIEAMDSTLEGAGSTEDDFVDFINKASEAGKGRH